jgi:hypothetical protein
MNSSSLRHSPQHIIFQAKNLYLLAKKSLRFLCRGAVANFPIGHHLYTSSRFPSETIFHRAGRSAG